MDTFLNDLAQYVRLADFIDVALVAGFFYVLIAWMRRSASYGTLRRIAVVVVVFAAIYVPARFLDMYLVGRVAEVLFIAIVLALVLIFQSDFRRMLDQAGSLVFSGSSPSSDSSPVDQLTESVAHMANEHIGALIAIRGNEPWDRHARGGVGLGGAVSPPLLYSIFDHRTPGHDGALLMEGNRIIKFAAHLPLAEGKPAASQYGGTRHAAALGLAERCDAFVIVVSEERGTISVAHNGTIEEVPSDTEFKERLREFWDKHYSEEASAARTWLARRRVQTAAVSILSAVALWFIFAYSPETIYRSFEVPIEYRNVPQEWLIQSEERWVDVTLSGSERGFRLIDPDRLTITLDLHEPQEGVNEFTIDRDDLDLPQRVFLESVQPETVELYAQPLTPVTLPVEVPTEGTLPDGLRLIRLSAEPDSVTVLTLQNGPEHHQISTEPVDLSEISEETTLRQPLVRAANMRFPPDAETEVDVHVEVDAVENEEDDGAD